MSRFDKIRLAASLATVVCAGAALHLAVPPHLRLLPFILAYAAYRAGTLIDAAKGPK